MGPSTWDQVGMGPSDLLPGVFGELFEASAHARIAEMEHSGVRPCRENGNYLKWVAN